MKLSASKFENTEQVVTFFTQNVKKARGNFFDACRYFRYLEDFSAFKNSRLFPAQPRIQEKAREPWQRKYTMSSTMSQKSYLGILLWPWHKVKLRFNPELTQDFHNYANDQV